MKKIKYVVALNGRQSAKQHTTTNQKQAAATEGTTEGRRDEREARGKQGTIVLMALEVEEELKTKINR